MKTRRIPHTPPFVPAVTGRTRLDKLEPGARFCLGDCRGVVIGKSPDNSILVRLKDDTGTRIIEWSGRICVTELP